MPACRLDFIRLPAGADPSSVHARTNVLQATIWSHLREIMQERRDPVATSLLTSLNETFDLATAQRYAFESGPAPQLVLLLLAMTMASMGGLGYQFGLRGQPAAEPCSCCFSACGPPSHPHHRSRRAAGGPDPDGPGPLLWTIKTLNRPQPPAR